MARNKPDGFPEWTDPDDAPEPTTDMLADAEVFEGDTFVPGAADPVDGETAAS